MFLLNPKNLSRWAAAVWTLMAGTAFAQSVPTTCSGTPLFCDQGAQTKTVVSQSQTPVPGTPYDHLTADYLLTYSGPVAEPLNGGPGSSASADINLAYHGTYFGYTVGTTPIPVGSLTVFQGAHNIQVSARSLDVTVNNGTSGGDVYSLSTPDPNAVGAGNAVAVAGRYANTDISNGISFGKITGTASLVARPNDNFTGPIAIQFNTTMTETTRLDYTGLTTPTVSVTNGIDMNGSKVTNLAAGTAATDAVNVAQLGQEAATRQAADNTLAQGLASETASRMAADTALSNRIDALSTRMDQFDSRLDQLDRRASAGTAVAIAMGGGTFLPGMRFNLTANVSTYRGEQAGAIQFGAMVSPHAVVNAAVATSFGGNGGTGARAGFTLGW